MACWGDQIEVSDLPKTQSPQQAEEKHNKKAARRRRSPRRPVDILPRNALAVVARVDVRLIWVRLLTKTVILAPPPVVGAAVADSPLRVRRRRRRLLGLARPERPRVLGTDAAQDAACARTRRVDGVWGVFLSSEARAGLARPRRRLRATGAGVKSPRQRTDRRGKGNKGHGKTQSLDSHGEVRNALCTVASVHQPRSWSKAEAP